VIRLASLRGAATSVRSLLPNFYRPNSVRCHAPVSITFFCLPEDYAIKSGFESDFCRQRSRRGEGGVRGPHEFGSSSACLLFSLETVARLAELPSLPFFNRDSSSLRWSSGVNGIYWNTKDYGVLQRVDRRRVQLRDGEHRSRVLRRGLSYDQTTGRIPVDVSAETGVRFPAETRGLLSQIDANRATSCRNPR
jgi:hypothetical protein